MACDGSEGLERMAKEGEKVGFVLSGIDASNAGSAWAGFQNRKLCPRRPCTASATFWQDVKLPMTEVIWKERAMPRNARR